MAFPFPPLRQPDTGLTIAQIAAGLGYVIGEPSTHKTVNQNIGGGATYTWQIPLDAADYSYGLIHVQCLNAIVPNAGALVVCTTASNASRAISAGWVYSLYAVGPNVYIMSNSLDSQLTKPGSFGSNNSDPLGGISITSARINGSNLEIVFRNEIGSTQNLQAAARFSLFKIPVNSTL